MGENLSPWGEDFSRPRNDAVLQKSPRTQAAVSRSTFYGSQSTAPSAVLSKVGQGIPVSAYECSCSFVASYGSLSGSRFGTAGKIA